MISTDRNIFKEDSAVRQRMIEYGTLFDELHIIVFSMKKLSLNNTQLSKNTFAYPTNALFKPFYLSRAYRVAKDILEKRKNDTWVISTQDPFETGTVGLRLKRKFKFPLQVQLHGDFGNPLFKKESPLNRIRLGMAEEVLRYADCTRAVSKRIIDGVQKRYNLKNAPFLLPIRAEREKILEAETKIDVHKKYPQFDFIVLMSSRLEKVKNITLAIESFKEVVKENKKAGLIILGEGTEKGSLISFTKKLNLEENVVFEGWQDDVFSYMKTADIFLNTSNHEGYCLSLVEAALSKCPIVTTKIGVVGELINEENALICDVGDLNCVANAIKALVRDKEQAKKRGDIAFERVNSSVLTKQEYLIRYKDSIEKCSI